jgi:hypothetical protein
MNNNSSIWIGMTVGSLVGGYVPSLWDAGIFSLWGVLFSALGGFAGIWVGYRMR